MQIPDCVHPPRDAYRFRPSPHEILHGKGKKINRNIFWYQELSEFELEKLSRLEQEIKKYKIKIPDEWDRNHLLRFCYGTGWKTRKAVTVLLNHLKWREINFPHGYMALYTKVEEMLSEGCLYVHGRDHYYRPIIVMNFAKYNFKKHTVDEYMAHTAFVLEFVVTNMMIPGQVENWVAISDMSKQGFGSLDLGSLKKITNILQENYRCRLGVNHIINATNSFFFMWKLIKPFLDDAAIEKMTFQRDANLVHLFAHCNPNQVEQKYGGTAPNLTRFWPPVVPEGPYTPSKGDIKGSDNETNSEYDTYHKFFPIIHQEEIEFLEPNNESFENPEQSNEKKHREPEFYEYQGKEIYEGENPLNFSAPEDDPIDKSLDPETYDIVVEETPKKKKKKRKSKRRHTSTEPQHVEEEEMHDASQIEIYREEKKEYEEAEQVDVKSDMIQSIEIHEPLHITEPILFEKESKFTGCSFWCTPKNAKPESHCVLF